MTYTLQIDANKKIMMNHIVYWTKRGSICVMVKPAYTNCLWIRVIRVILGILQNTCNGYLNTYYWIGDR